jgi:hypothetical protein
MEERYTIDGSDATPVKACVEFTLVEAKAALTKRYQLDENGALKKTAPRMPSSGLMRRERFEGSAYEVLRDFAKRIEGASPQEAIICGSLPEGRDEWALCTADEEDRSTGRAARSKRNIKPKAGPALLCLDLDVKDYPDMIQNRIEQAGGLQRVLSEVFPDIASAASLCRPSVSSFVGRPGADDPAVRGEHRYFVVKDGRDAAPFAKRLVQRLQLDGWAWGRVTGGGGITFMGLIDSNASEPYRLCYEADAVLGDGLEYLKPRRAEVSDGGLLDTHKLPELTDEEEQKLRQIRTEIENRPDLQAEAEARRRARHEKLRDHHLSRGGTKSEAEKLFASFEADELQHHEEIHLDTGEVVTVGDILRNRAEYHGKTCAVPLEPDYGGGRNMAIIYTEPSANIFSQAHGGMKFRLLDDPQRFFSPIDSITKVSRATGPLEMGRLNWEAMQSIPPRPWLYGRKVLRGYTTFVASPGGVGKTAFTIAMAIASLTGNALLHDKPVEPLRVWILNLEDDQDEMERRVKAAIEYYGVDPVVLRHLGVNSGRDRPFRIVGLGRDQDFVVQPDFHGVIAEMRRNSVDLLIVDPFLRSHSVPENDNSAQDEVMRLYNQIAHETKAGVVLVHHVKKGAVAGDMDGLRGGSTQGAGARSVLTLSPMSAEEAKKLGIEEKKRRLYVRIDDAKNNMAPPESKAEWLKLESVNIGNGTPEYPDGDFVQVATRYDVPGAWDGLPDDAEREMLAAIDAGIPAEGGSEKYSARSQDERWVGHMLKDSFGRTEAQAKELISGWLKAGVIRTDDYRSPGQRKGRKGLVLVNADETAHPVAQEGIFG